MQNFPNIANTSNKHKAVKNYNSYYGSLNKLQKNGDISSMDHLKMIKQFWDAEQDDQKSQIHINQQNIKKIQIIPTQKRISTALYHNRYKSFDNLHQARYNYKIKIPVKQATVYQVKSQKKILKNRKNIPNNYQEQNKALSLLNQQRSTIKNMKKITQMYRNSFKIAKESQKYSNRQNNISTKLINLLSKINERDYLQRNLQKQCNWNKQKTLINMY